MSPNNNGYTSCYTPSQQTILGKLLSCRQVRISTQASQAMMALQSTASLRSRASHRRTVRQPAEHRSDQDGSPQVDIYPEIRWICR